MLSSSYRDRLLMELTDCCDDEDEPLIEVNSICIEAFSEAVARRNPTRNVPSEAIRWLIDTHCNRIIGTLYPLCYVVYKVNSRATASLLQARISREHN